jgi:hypothetical protein
MSTQIEAKRISDSQILKRLRLRRQLDYKRLGRLVPLTRLRRTWTKSELPVWMGFSISRLG